MRRTYRYPIIIAAVALLSLTLPSAQGPRDVEVVEGEVVSIDPAAATTDGQTWNEATVRTRNGERARLRLHQNDEGPMPCAVGDQIRARVMAGGPQEGAYLVRNMRNWRTRENVQVRDKSGDVIPARDRVRQRSQDGSGAGGQQQVRTRARIHEPGTGGGSCPATGGRGGGHRGGR